VCRRTRQHFNAVPRAFRKKLHEPVNGGLAAFDRRCPRKRPYKARFEIAGIAEIDLFEFFAAFVQSEQLKIGRCMIEPRHTLGDGPPMACRHNHLESAEMPARICMLTTVVEPENAEREYPVDYR
jgi:hypothetical protein